MLELFIGLYFAIPPDPRVLTVPTEIVDNKTEWIQALHLCENRQNLEKWVDSNGYYSYGYLSYQMRTWLYYGEPFGTTKENISSTTLQIQVARSMLDKGLQSHWYTCSQKATEQVGVYGG